MEGVDAVGVELAGLELLEVFPGTINCVAGVFGFPAALGLINICGLGASSASAEKDRKIKENKKRPTMKKSYHVGAH